MIRRSESKKKSSKIRFEKKKYIGKSDFLNM